MWGTSWLVQHRFTLDSPHDRAPSSSPFERLNRRQCAATTPIGYETRPPLPLSLCGVTPLEESS